MTRTALGAETKKEEKIIFISDDTRRNVYRIYDFKTGSVITECLNEGWQTSGSVRVVKPCVRKYDKGTSRSIDKAGECGASARNSESGGYKAICTGSGTFGEIRPTFRLKCPA